MVATINGVLFGLSENIVRWAMSESSVAVVTEAIEWIFVKTRWTYSAVGNTSNAFRGKTGFVGIRSARPCGAGIDLGKKGGDSDGR